MTSPRLTLTRLLAAAFLLGGAALVTGCTGGPKGTTISGVVTYKGAPVTGGQIAANYPDNKKVTGTINTDGSYTLYNLTPGTAKVTIDTEMLKQASEMKQKAEAEMKAMKGQATKEMLEKMKGNMPKVPEMPGGGDIGVYMKVPSKYTSPATTPISWEISSSEKKNVELTD